MALDQALALHAEVLETQPELLGSVVHASLICAGLGAPEIAAFFRGSPLPALRLRFPVVLPAEDRAQLPEVPGPVLCMATSPAQRWLAAATQRGGALIWSLHTNHLVHRLDTGTSQILCMAWLDEERLLMGAADGSVRIAHIEAESQALDGHGQAVRCCAAAGGRLLTGSDDGTARLWLGEGQAPLVLSGQGGLISSCAMSEELAATGTSTGEVALWSLAEPAPLWQMECHAGAVTGCALLNDLLLTVGADGWLRGWSLQLGDLVFELHSQGGALSCLALSADGRRAVSSRADHSAVLWDLEDRRHLGLLLGHRREITSAAWAQRTLWTGSRDRSIRSWTARDCRHPEAALHHSSSVRACAFGGEHLLAGTRGGRLHLWHARSGRSVWASEAQGGAIYDVAFSPSGQRLASVCTTGEVSLWEQGQRRVLTGHQGPVTCCAFVREHLLLTGGRDHSLRLWDLHSGRTTRVLDGHEHWVRCCAVRPGSAQVVSGSYDGTLRVWDLEGTGTPQVLRHHSQAVVGCAVSASGTHLASVGLDGQLVVWSLEQGGLERAIQAHDQPCAGVAILGDERVYTVAQDRWVRGWELRSGEACGAVRLTGAQDSVAVVEGALAVGDRSGNLWVFEG